MLSYANSVPARPRGWLNKFKNGRTQWFNSRRVVERAYFQTKSRKKKTLSLFGYSYNLAYEVHIVNWKCIVSNLMSGEIFPFRSFWTLNISLVKFSSKVSYYFNMITPLVKTTLTFLPISIDSLMTRTLNLETSITLLTHICTFYFLEPTKKLDLSLQQISVVTIFLAVF